MDRMIATALAVAAVCLGASPSSAQTFTPVPHGSHRFDLDTAPGAFSLWSTSDLSGLTGIRAKFAMRQMRVDRKWSPSFRFAVNSGEESVSLVGVGDQKKGLMILALRRYRGSALVSEELFLTMIAVNDIVDLAIDWEPSGKVTVQVKSPQSLEISPSGENHEMMLGGIPTGLEVTASTGELEVIDLKLGSTQP